MIPATKTNTTLLHLYVVLRTAMLDKASSLCFKILTIEVIERRTAGNVRHESFGTTEVRWCHDIGLSRYVDCYGLTVTRE